MQIQLNQRDLSVVTDALSLFRPSERTRRRAVVDTSQVFHQAEADRPLEVTTAQLEAALDAVTAYARQVPRHRREGVENTAATIAAKLYRRSAAASG